MISTKFIFANFYGFFFSENLFIFHFDESRHFTFKIKDFEKLFILMWQLEVTIKGDLILARKMIADNKLKLAPVYFTQMCPTI